MSSCMAEFPTRMSPSTSASAEQEPFPWLYPYREDPQHTRLGQPVFRPLGIEAFGRPRPRSAPPRIDPQEPRSAKRDQRDSDEGTHAVAPALSEERGQDIGDPGEESPEQEQDQQPPERDHASCIGSARHRLERCRCRGMTPVDRFIEALPAKRATETSEALPVFGEVRRITRWPHRMARRPGQGCRDSVQPAGLRRARR